MSSDAVAREKDTTTIPVVPARPPLGAWITVVRGRAFPERFRLSAGTCRLGAGTDTDIVVDDPAVSRRHVELELAPEGVQVRDLQSRNGTFCQGQRIQTATLSLGSSITIGATQVRIDADLEQLDSATPSSPDRYGMLLGSSPEIRRLFSCLQRLEGCLMNVLIEGESGTGKELVARALHDHSPVSSGPYVAVNCGALDRQLAKSELFGHKKGAFTGATENRVGVFEAAHGGTLFLDEFAELPLDVQPMLLRALETSTIVRLGENVARPVKVRVVAATNRDLAEEVRSQRFREDLYYRITVIRLVLPPLRARPADIDVLARHFARQEGLDSLPASFLAELGRQRWPGNARELKNAVQAYIALGTMESDGRPADQEPSKPLQSFVDPTVEYSVLKDRLLDAFTRAYLVELMEHAGGNQSQAARLSGIERSYLGKLLTKYSVKK